MASGGTWRPAGIDVETLVSKTYERILTGNKKERNLCVKNVTKKAKSYDVQLSWNKQCLKKKAKAEETTFTPK